MTDTDVNADIIIIPQKELFKEIQYCVNSFQFIPDLSKNEISIKKYIDEFIQNTWFTIDQGYYDWEISASYIYDLTTNVIEILKKNKENIILIFNSCFIDSNKLLTMLPKHIQYIILEGTNRNIEINKELYLNFTNLPKNLIYLNIDYKYNYSLTLDYLPLGLKVLILCAKIDVPIDNLPNGLEILEIGKNFNHPINNLPDNIKILIFKKRFNNWNFHYIEPNNYYLHKINRLPISLEILIFDYIQDEIICNIDFSKLINLTYLALSYNFDEVAFFNSSTTKWPPNLKKLHIGKTYNHTISKLPPSLECLIIHQNFNLETNLLDVPNNLKIIIIDVRNEIIYNNKCHYETFKKIKNKFPHVKVKYYSTL